MSSSAITMITNQFVPADEIEKALLNLNFMTLSDRYIQEYPDAICGMLVFSRYAWRNNSAAGLSVYYRANETQTLVHLCAAAAGSGYLDLSLGFEDKFIRQSRSILEEIGFRAQSE